VLVSAAIVFPSNMSTLPYYVHTSLSSLAQVSSVSPKSIATLNTLLELPRREPIQPLLGLGLGQYSSRAGLIMSGTYLSRPFYLEPRYRTVSYDLIYSLQEAVRERRYGSTFFPYYSWLSVYGELGMLGVALVLALGIVVFKNLRRIRSAPQEIRALQLSIALTLTYVMVLGFQDNYWEFAQAVFAPLVLAKLSYDWIRRYGQYTYRAHGTSAAG